MEFFTKSLRRLTFEEVVLKMNAQREKRIRLDFRLQLTDENLENCPDEVRAAYDAINEASNGIIESTLATEFEHQSIELYELPDSRKPMIAIPNCTVRSLQIKREVKENQANGVFLTFNTNVMYSKELWAWCGDYKENECWAAFFEAQAEIADDDQPTDEEQHARLSDMETGQDHLYESSGKDKPAKKSSKPTKKNKGGKR